MVIFNSHVSLPEGILKQVWPMGSTVHSMLRCLRFVQLSATAPEPPWLISCRMIPKPSKPAGSRQASVEPVHVMICHGYVELEWIGGAKHGQTLSPGKLSLELPMHRESFWERQSWPIWSKKRLNMGYPVLYHLFSIPGKWYQKDPERPNLRTS